MSTLRGPTVTEVVGPGLPMDAEDTTRADRSLVEESLDFVGSERDRVFAEDPADTVS